MKRTFITYGDDNYADSLKRIKAEAEATGLFDEVRLYTPADLPEPFLTYTRTYRRGGGYWLWKPFVIKDALDRAAEGDVVVYADAGCTIMPHNDWTSYFDVLKRKEELFFLAPGKSRKWCKREVFDFFHTPNDLWKKASQIQATFIMAAKRGDNEVITKWYETALNHPELFTDADGSTPQDARFREHRHDQAVLTACVCTASRPWRFGLKVEKVEHRYAAGQAVFASRISNSATRGHTDRPKGRTVSLLEHIIVNPLRVLSARIIFTLSSL